MEEWAASEVGLLEDEASTQEVRLSSDGRMRVGDTFKLRADSYLNPELISMVL